MLNIEEAVEVYESYIKQNNYILRCVFYSIIVFIFIDIIRQQVSEINLLQLIPGLYLILLFTAFIALVISSNFLTKIPYNVDSKNISGTKTFGRFRVRIIVKIRTILLMALALLTLCSVLPLSLDSFNSYVEGELENLWSFDEVLNLEILLLIFLIILSQTPIYGFSSFNTEKILDILPQFWKNLSLTIFLTAAFITPTIDGYTQFIFASSAISLYFFIITTIKQRSVSDLQGFIGYIS